MIERILGALLGYDEVHGTELVTTLTTYFQENRSLKLTARRLTIHPQTLRYRLKRVQEITGRDINSTQSISELWWAVSMLDAKY
jgi:purine catabolism regulator